MIKDTLITAVTVKVATLGRTVKLLCNAGSSRVKIKASVSIGLIILVTVAIVRVNGPDRLVKLMFGAQKPQNLRNRQNLRKLPNRQNLQHHRNQQNHRNRRNHRRLPNRQSLQSLQNLPRKLQSPQNPRKHLKRRTAHTPINTITGTVDTTTITIHNTERF